MMKFVLAIALAIATLATVPASAGPFDEEETYGEAFGPGNPGKGW